MTNLGGGADRALLPIVVILDESHLECSASRQILLELANILTWGHFWGFLIGYQNKV